MCGIVGVTGNPNAVNILVHGLQKLEYRGYDSAGIYANNGHKGRLIKRVGKVERLKKATEKAHLKGTSGIGHTRWATNGVVNEANAHPQYSQDDRFYLVHNGVVGNYKQLRDKYLKGVHFSSQTDTETIVQLEDHFVTKDGMSDTQAFKKTLHLLGNTQYAISMVDNKHPNTIFFAKNKNPLLIGIGKHCNVLCSDSLAMLNVTHDFLELKDKEWGYIKPTQIMLYDKAGNRIMNRKPFHVKLDASDTGKGPYKFYMLKEINEQPAIMRKLSKIYLNQDGSPKINQKLLNTMRKADRIYIVGAGTSCHAGMVGENLFENLAHVPTEADDSSEFAYAHPMLSKHPFFIFLTQSGETADSRVVLDKEVKAGYPTLTITNVAHSTLDRDAEFTLYLHAGAEVSVASTKAYTSQIAVEAILAKALGELKGVKEAKNFNMHHQLALVANGMQALIDNHSQYEKMAKKYFVHTHDAFYIGRQIDYKVAVEAALKLKEISYVHTDGFAAGELKHGTIALISKGTPVLGIITNPSTAELTRSNLDETLSRGAKTFTIVSKKLANKNDDIILPDVNNMLTPLLSIIPAQLIAYYTSLNKGLNVDKPRNLAKSVTVE